MVLFILQNNTLKADWQNVSLLTEEPVFLYWTLIIFVYLGWFCKTTQQIAVRKGLKWGHTAENSLILWKWFVQTKVTSLSLLWAVWSLSSVQFPTLAATLWSKGCHLWPGRTWSRCRPRLGELLCHDAAHCLGSVLHPRVWLLQPPAQVGHRQCSKCLSPGMCPAILWLQGSCSWAMILHQWYTTEAAVSTKTRGWMYLEELNISLPLVRNDRKHQTGVSMVYKVKLLHPPAQEMSHHLWGHQQRHEIQAP